jgi:hypothetical protein
MKELSKVVLIGYLACAMLVIGMLPQDANAMLAPAMPEATSRAADMQQVQHVLESKVVAQRLAEVGLSEDEIQTRLGALTDEQLHSVASQLDGLQPGGDVLITLLIIIGAVVLVLAIIGLARSAIS